jgi:hypothetical protein
LQDIEDGAIVEGYVVLSGHEHVSSCATVRFAYFLDEFLTGLVEGGGIVFYL